MVSRYRAPRIRHAVISLRKPKRALVEAADKNTTAGHKLWAWVYFIFKKKTGAPHAVTYIVTQSSTARAAGH